MQKAADAWLNAKRLNWLGSQAHRNHPEDRLQVFKFSYFELNPGVAKRKRFVFTLARQMLKRMKRRPSLKEINRVKRKVWRQWANAMEWWAETRPDRIQRFLNRFEAELMTRPFWSVPDIHWDMIREFEKHNRQAAAQKASVAVKALKSGKKIIDAAIRNAFTQNPRVSAKDLGNVLLENPPDGVSAEMVEKAVNRPSWDNRVSRLRKCCI